MSADVDNRLCRDCNAMFDWSGNPSISKEMKKNTITSLKGKLPEYWQSGTFHKFHVLNNNQDDAGEDEDYNSIDLDGSDDDEDEDYIGSTVSSMDRVGHGDEETLDNIRSTIGELEQELIQHEAQRNQNQAHDVGDAEPRPRLKWTNKAKNCYLVNSETRSDQIMIKMAERCCLCALLLSIIRRHGYDKSLHDFEWRLDMALHYTTLKPISLNFHIWNDKIHKLEQRDFFTPQG